MLTEREKLAVAHFNAALDAEDEGRSWSDCGETDAQILLNALRRLSAQPTPTAPTMIDMAGAAPLADADLAIVPRWVAVGDRLPEELERVLIARPRYLHYVDECNTVHIGNHNNGGWYAKGEDYDGDDLLDQSVTHWQPLPAAPTTNAGKEPGQC